MSRHSFTDIIGRAFRGLRRDSMRRQRRRPVEIAVEMGDERWIADLEKRPETDRGSPDDRAAEAANRTEQNDAMAREVRSGIRRGRR